jgi:hypothetical protein
MMRAMIKATAKVIKEMSWWQKALIGSAATVAFSAAAKVMGYFVQEIDQPLHRKSDSQKGSGSAERRVPADPELN